MAVTYFNYASTPADNGSNATDPTAVTPPASMQAGDLVFLICQGRSGTPAISNTGGQSWSSLTQRSTTNIVTNCFWCRYNGTWSANPSVGYGSATNNTVLMLVFRPTGTSYTWAVDVAESSAAYAATLTPTITGFNTNTNGALVIAAWTSNDDNTWGSLTAGWSTTAVAQFRNLAGNPDSSVTAAWKIMPTAGATGNVSKTQSALGSDPGTYYLIAFKEVAAVDITVTPTGVLGTGSVGTATVAVPVTAAATGVAGTGSVGSPTVSGTATYIPTGVAGTASVGTATASIPISFSVTGVSGTASVGSVTVTVPITASVTGVAGTASIGSPTVSGTALTSATGVAGTASVGTVTAGVAVTVAVTGVFGASSIGSTTVTAAALTVAPSISRTASVGSPTVTAFARHTATGVQATGSVGSPTVTGSATYIPSGVSATGQVGAVTVSAGGSISVLTTGVNGTGSVGSPTISGTAIVSSPSVSGTTSIGSATVRVNVATTATGVSSTGQIGSVVAYGSSLTVAPAVSGSGLVGSVLTQASANTAAPSVAATISLGSVQTSGNALVLASSLSATSSVGEVNAYNWSDIPIDETVLVFGVVANVFIGEVHPFVRPNGVSPYLPVLASQADRDPFIAVAGVTVAYREATVNVPERAAVISPVESSVTID